MRKPQHVRQSPIPPARVWAGVPPRLVALVAVASSLLVAACSRSEATRGGSGAGTATPAAPIASSEPTPDVPAIVFLGDSLTAGRGLDERDGLPALIQKKVDAAGLKYRVINGGRSGDTTASGVSRLDWYFRSSIDLAVLVIGLGSNDAMRGQPLKATEANLHRIIARAREHQPKVAIYVWQLRTFPNMGQDYGSAYEEVFPRVAKAEGATLIPFPLQGVAGNAKLNQDDGIHPTQEGMRIVADNVWRTLGPELGVK